VSRCFVIPAKAGIQHIDVDGRNFWIPAFAGMPGIFAAEPQSIFTVVNVKNNGTAVPLTPPALADFLNFAKEGNI